MEPSPGQIRRNYETGDLVLVMGLGQTWRDRAGNEYSSWMLYSQDGVTEVEASALLEETESVDEAR
jgi:hypothetical protein